MIEYRIMSRLDTLFAFLFVFKVAIVGGLYFEVTCRKIAIENGAPYMLLRISTAHTFRIRLMLSGCPTTRAVRMRPFIGVNV